MKTFPCSPVVLFALATACAKASPPDKSVAEGSPPRSAETGESAAESLTPASRNLDPAEGRSAAATSGAEPSERDVAPSFEDDSGESAEQAPARGSEAVQPAERTPDVIYVPTPQPIVDEMLTLAKVTKDDVVYDLGCGDGRIVVTAAKKYGARAIGFDIDPKRIEEARANVKKNAVEDLVSIEQKDIFTLDLSPASVVTLYLLPSLNQRLVPQLEKLEPGSRVVSHDYGIKGVVPVQHLSMKPAADAREHEIYFWTVPFQRKPSLPALGVPAPTVNP